MKDFEEWLHKAEKTFNVIKEDIGTDPESLNVQARQIKMFKDEVNEHKPELMSLNEEGQKVIDNGKDCKKMLADFRKTTLPKEFNETFVEEPATNITRIKLVNINERYEKLSQLFAQHLEKLNTLEEKHQKYHDVLSELVPWLEDTEKIVNKQAREPVASEPKKMQKQIAKSKSVSDDIIAHGVEVERAHDTGEDLAEHQPEIKPEVEGQLSEIDEKYHQVEYMSTDRVLQVDIDSHKPSVDTIQEAASKLVSQGEPSATKPLQVKLDSLSDRYQRASDKIERWADYLQSDLDHLSDLLKDVEELEDWLVPALEDLQSPKVDKLNPTELGKKLTGVSHEVDTHRPLYKKIKQLGHDIVKDPQATDTSMVSEILKNVDKNWDALEDTLDRRNKKLQDKEKTYKKFSKTTKDADDWLGTMETKFEDLEPATHEKPTLEKQIEEQKPIQKEVENYKPKIEEVKTIGSHLDTLNEPDEAVTMAAPVRRSALIAEPDTLGKVTRKPTVVAPGDLLKGPTAAQNKVADITERYDSLEHKLDDRQTSLMDNLSVATALEEKTDALEDVKSWIGDVEKVLKEEKPKTDDSDKLKDQMDKEKALQEDIRDHRGEVHSAVKGAEVFLDNSRDNLTPDQQSGLLRLSDDVKTGYDKLADVSQDNIRKTQAAINDAEKRMKEKIAVEAKCKEQTSHIASMLDWIKTSKEKLGSQQPMFEEVQPLTSQQMGNKAIQEDVIEHQEPITATIQSAQLLLEKEEDKLSDTDKEELQKVLGDLKTSYDVLLTQSETRVKKLETASEELIKFEEDHDTFREWLGDAENTLSDITKELGRTPEAVKEQVEKIKEFAKDVEKHREEMNNVNEEGQKVKEVAQEYKKDLSEFRSSTLPKQFNKEFTEAPQQSVIKDKLTKTNEDYNKLATENKQQVEKLHDVLEKHIALKYAVDEVLPWLQTQEEELTALVTKPIAADPAAVQVQIEELKNLNDAVISQAPRVDRVLETGHELVEVQSEMKSDVDKLITDVTDKYKAIESQVTDRCNVLQTALTESQGVQDGLDTLLTWSSDLHDRIEHLVATPVVVKKDPLTALSQQQKVLQSDLESHKPSIEALNTSAAKLMKESPPDAAKTIQDKLDDLNVKFYKEEELVKKHGDYVQSRLDKLAQFINEADKLEDWLLPTLETLEGVELDKLDLPQVDEKLKNVASETKSKKPEFEQVKKHGDELLKDPKANDTEQVSEILNNVNKNWEALQDALDMKRRQADDRQYAKQRFVSAHKVATKWLDGMDEKVDEFEPAAYDVYKIQAQIEENKPLMKDYTEFQPKILQVAELGKELDAISQPKTQATIVPHRRSSTLASLPDEEITPIAVTQVQATPAKDFLRGESCMK
uniref:Dystonin-like n=1 Tax=Saccoglossus kowalevskii TaxID=10224 RepID=A0ABM0M682_SACKO|nr:PREDICTED: dystonin-like [Saccoglossus kowalevskii]